MATGMDQERVFAAIAVKGEAQERLAAWSHLMQQQYAFRKWTAAADFHITLQFYGDVDRAKLPELSHTLAATVAGHSPFKLQLGRPAYFGLPERPRVWWIDPEGDRSALNALQHDIVHACEAIGYKAEQRPYHPHITIARKYAGSEPFEALATEDIHLDGIAWQVEEVVLYCTRMGQIPMYELAGCFPLTKDRLL
ncbi:RNA 2',3'-cyclic phosphodiesterase [Paenibacillus wenxiniae]|uniref:RNA 2',3'-cyclic phosphodiesterase n=1 Tax=Paenibacillus wenxiniae TaxID=1636843 RepID=A0ABW4RIR2_9BACL